jgi:glutamine cyclotransferase
MILSQSGRTANFRNGRGGRLLPFLLLLLSLLTSCAERGEVGRPTASTLASPAPPLPPLPPLPAAQPPVRRQSFGYEIVRTYPHDRAAFTQGLLYHEGFLYESTGLHGQSSLRKIELETGRVIQRIEVPSQYFAEGLALFGQRLYQVTWQSRLGFVYDLQTFERQRIFNYRGEGWGLTHDGKSLILSDGTSRLRYLHPETFDPQQEVEVFDGERPLTLLNELEYIEGEIWANVWQSDRIARIQPATGGVTGWVDLSGLLTPEDRRFGVDVLNGIAYDPQGKRIFVTGKLWPKLFEIRLTQSRPTLTR